MEQMGPERAIMMALAPTSYNREVGRYMRWEYPRDDASWTLWRLVAEGGATADRPARDSFLVRLARLLTGRGGAGIRIGQAVPR
jgi:hypothetical protein